MSSILYTCHAHPQLGFLLWAQSPRGLRHLWLGDSADALIETLKSRYAESTYQLHEDAAALSPEVDATFALLRDPTREFALPLDIQGSDFAQQVWRALREIPAGNTVSYSELAALINAPRATRAVASACGRNELALIIPCHRALGKDGALRGYRWDLTRKKYLLALESGSIA